MDDLYQQQMESILLIATECVLKKVLLEAAICMEKIVQEEWEMAVVDNAESKFNFTSKVTDLQRVDRLSY